MERTIKSPLALVLLVIFSNTAAAQGLEVTYAGQLNADQPESLAGIFALEFRLYETEEAEDSLWEEQHFVAVLEGEYEITLGSHVLLDPSYLGREMVLGVAFNGEEFERNPLLMETAPTDSGGVDSNWEDPCENSDLICVDIADRTALAHTAEIAEDGESWAGRDFETVDSYSAILDHFIGHFSDPFAHLTEEERPNIGRTHTILPHVGGEGGAHYERICPDGYAAIGVRGGSAMYVDSIEIICAPFE
ncbi:hypothetical protein KKC91_12855 [bacterium]|nr:hypothetical protein [bacterium]